MCASTVVPLAILTLSLSKGEDRVPSIFANIRQDAGAAPVTACPAAVPAILPNTAPAARPEPPG